MAGSSRQSPNNRVNPAAGVGSGAVRRPRATAAGYAGRHTQMNTGRKLLLVAAILLAVLPTLSGCSSYDSEYFPYAMKGLNVLVYDNKANKEYFGGFVEASYFSRKEALSSCAARAAATARQYHLPDWGYVCCTVTSSSSCVTKVR